MNAKVLILFVALAATAAKAQVNYAVSGNISYVTSSPNAAGDIVIASTYSGHPVRYISADAFFGCNTLTSAVIPNSVTNIGSSAFASCHNLTSVTIPNSIQTIGTAAFLHCTNLANAAIPNGVTSIGEQAFGYCTSLTSTVIPDSVTSIQTFVSSAGGYIGSVFEYCTNLTNVVIGNGLADIGPNTFIGCIGLTNVVIGTNVTRISEEAFGGCSNLMSVVIPDSVTIIDIGAFDSSGLTSITIPKSVINIDLLFGTIAFKDCASLTNFTVAAGNPQYSSLNGVLFNQDQSTLIEFPGGVGGNYTVPNSVTNLGSYAFEDCSKLNSVTFPGNAPPLNYNNNYGGYIFSGDSATIYYYYGASGWGKTYAFRPAVMLGAPAPLLGGSVSVQSGNFSFTVAGVTNQLIVVEASTNLANWDAVWTNTLSGTNVNFTDPQWTNYPTRYYRALSH